MSQNKFAAMNQETNAKMFPGNNVKMFQNNNVDKFLNKFVRMFLGNNVIMLLARYAINNLVTMAKLIGEKASTILLSMPSFKVHLISLATLKPLLLSSQKQVQRCNTILYSQVSGI